MRSTEALPLNACVVPLTKSKSKQKIQQKMIELVSEFFKSGGGGGGGVFAIKHLPSGRNRENLVVEENPSILIVNRVRSGSTAILCWLSEVILNDSTWSVVTPILFWRNKIYIVYSQRVLNRAYSENNNNNENDKVYFLNL